MQRLFEFIFNHYVYSLALVVVTYLLIQEFFDTAFKKFKPITPMLAVAKMNESDIDIIDVREAPDFAQGHIENAVNAPLSKLSEQIHKISIDKSASASRLPERHPLSYCRQVAAADLLEVALKAQVGVPHGEQLVVDRAVRIVAGHASFAHRFMLEDPGTRLFAVTFGAGLVDARHEDALGIVDFFAVRVVAIAAGHAAFLDRVTVLEAELSVGLEVTLETNGRILVGIDDELAFAATGVHVQAAEDRDTPRSRDLRLLRRRCCAAGAGNVAST